MNFWYTIAVDGIRDLLTGICLVGAAALAAAVCGRWLAQALKDADSVRLTEDETRLPDALVAAMLQNRAKGVFLFEGRTLADESYMGTKHITLRCYRRPCTPGDGSHLFEIALPISVTPVEDMFRWVDERWVLAHSLGNMLVSSAIKDHGLSYYAKYYMLNAAVPMEAYDRDASAAAMVDHDWRRVTNSVYSANWWQLFNNGDGRVALTWRERFCGITNVVNCYSASEDTLGNAGLNEWLAGKLARLEGEDQ